ncbi:MAG: hypothetical protein CR979_02460, partial [Propionibacterium sp.]
MERLKIFAAAVLAVPVILGAFVGASLIEKTLTEESNSRLKAAGITATVVFSGRNAWVTADASDIDEALKIVRGTTGVSRAEGHATGAIQPSSSPTPAETTVIVTPTVKESVTAEPSAKPGTPSASASADATATPVTPKPSPTKPSPTEEPAAKPIPKVVVQFGGGYADMLPGQKKKIKKISDWLKKYPKAKVEVIGHTDNKRTASFRKKLAV